MREKKVRVLTEDQLKRRRKKELMRRFRNGELEWQHGEKPKNPHRERVRVDNPPASDGVGGAKESA